MPITVIPAPAVVHAGRGSCLLSPDTAIASSPGCESVARLLQDRLRRATGFPFPLVDPRATTRAIDLAIDRRLAPESYEISVGADGVRLRGGDAAGVFHATQTLLQLCPPAIFRRTVWEGVEWVIPEVTIRDRPRFPWRGMLIDVSRHFFGRDAIFKLIDAIALHRMNVLHLHLTDDQGWRIEIDKYPLLTQVGSWRAHSVVDSVYTRPPGGARVVDSSPHNGFLTKDDIREIVRYAGERFVMVLPEIDLPGHSQAAIAAYPQLGNGVSGLGVWTDWGVSPHVLNVDESTIEFYKDVLDEVIDLFPSPFIHIGGDEVPKEEWRASPSARQRMRELGLADENELQSWFISRIAAHLAARGRRLVGWDEILEGGPPAGAAVMSWRGADGGIAAASAGHDVIMTPDEDTYLYHRQVEDRALEPLGADPVLTLERIFFYDPLPEGMPDSARAHVLGAQCQMWTEFVSSERQMHQMAFPRLSAFAEAVWRVEPPSRGAFSDFLVRLEVHEERLHAMDIDGYAPPASAVGISGVDNSRGVSND